MAAIDNDDANNLAVIMSALPASSSRRMAFLKAFAAYCMLTVSREENQIDAASGVTLRLDNVRGVYRSTRRSLTSSCSRDVMLRPACMEAYGILRGKSASHIKMSADSACRR